MRNIIIKVFLFIREEFYSPEFQKLMDQAITVAAIIMVIYLIMQ